MDGLPEKKEDHQDEVNVHVKDSSEGVKPASRKWSIRRITAIVAVISLVVCGTILTATLLTRKKQFTAERLVEVNLEPGEALVYRVEQVLEVRSGELQRGTLRTIVALHVINKTSEEYWFVFKIISITAEGENLETIGNVTQGRSLYFLVKVEHTSRSEVKETSKSTKVHETFELYGNQKYDAELTGYARAILTQLLPAVERSLYELVDGEKPDPNSEPKPENHSMFPGIVKMHREADTSDNDELLIKNKFNRSDVTNMTSDIDLDMSYTDSSVLNKRSGMVTKGEVHLTKRLNFGEPVQCKKGFSANMMNVSFRSKVTLLNHEKSRRSYLEDEELAYYVDFRDFIKLTAPKSSQKIRFQTSEREAPLNETSVELTALNTTCAGKDGREINLTTASHNSRHRSRRQNLVQELLSAPRQKTFTLFKKKVIGIDIQVKATIRIESIKKLYHLKLDKTEVDLTLQLGASVTTPLLRESIDTTKKETKKINGWTIKTGYSIPILGIVSLDLDFILSTPVSISVDPGSLSNSSLNVKVTPSASVTATLHGSVSVLIVRAGVYGDGSLILGRLPITVSYEASRPSDSDACLDVSADLKILDLTAGVFYQQRSCGWHGWLFRCPWGTLRPLYSFGRWSAFSLRRNMISECF